MLRGVAMVLATLVMASPVAATVFVTDCRQSVPAGETAILAADLACGSSPVWPFSALGVRLGTGATLELDGHSITGNDTGVGVDCESSGAVGRRTPCRVVGPGEVSHFELGIGVVGTVSVEDVTVRFNRFGIAVQKCCRLEVAHVVADANTIAGISAHRLTGVGVQANGNGHVGIEALFRFRLSGVTATGNGAGGGVSGRGRLANSIVVGNSGFDGTYDLLAYPRIRTRDSTCGGGVRLKTIFGPGGSETTKVLGSFDCR
jgi:hypothetical protein